MTALRRRTALSLLGAGMASLAGCSETSDETDPESDAEDEDEADDPIEGELPSYASILPTTENSSFFYGAIDVETMGTLLEDEGAETGREPTDPLVGNPVVVALLCSFGLRLLGTSAGFDAYMEHNETADGEEQFVYAEGVYALVGTYDRDELAADLEESSYSVETEADAYAVYTDDNSDEVVGVSDDVYAYSYPNGSDSEFDPIAAVERTVATAAGEREPKHQADADFERLLRAGDATGITCCLYTDDDEFDADTLADDQASDDKGLAFEFDAFDGAYGAHQQLAVSGDAGATARATVAYGSEDQVDEDRLESALGTEADAETVAISSADHSEATVTVEAEYGGEFARE
ncbi:hypothetical protein [Natrinema salifodinae]|uniref:Uncharacterized protein n=1 Tax=Natrinema salifodinae TaxID=1202768 RepID=A0A1I0QXM5_9EURY|nr:hypothetical protein [Natrinema salifodinae]SEW32304.1 hypothetical protein SAMN05216285_4081 [Natrinema salifodinae]